MRRTPSINPAPRSPGTVYLSNNGSHERQPLLLNTIPPELRTSMFEYPSSYVRILNDTNHNNVASSKSNIINKYDANNANVKMESNSRRKWWKSWWPRRHTNTSNNNNNENSLWAEQVRVFDATGNLTFTQTGVNTFRFRRLTPFYWLRAQSWKWLLSFSITLYLVILGMISVMYYFWAKMCGAGIGTGANAHVNSLHSNSASVSWITSLYFTTVSLAANGGYAGEDEQSMMNPSHICYTGRTLIVMLCSYVNIIFVGLVAALVVSKATATSSLANRIVFSTYCTLSSVRTAAHRECDYTHHHQHHHHRNKNTQEQQSIKKKKNIKNGNNDDDNLIESKKSKNDNEGYGETHKDENFLESEEEEYLDNDNDKNNNKKNNKKGKCRSWKLTFQMANTENTKPLANGTLRLFCVTAEPLKEYRKSQQRLQEYLRRRELLHRERELKWQRQQEQRYKDKMNKDNLQEVSQSKEAPEQENENAKTGNSPHNSLVSVALSKLLPSGFLDKDKDKEVSHVRSPHKQQQEEQEERQQQEDKETREKKISANEFAQSEVRVGDAMNAPHLLLEEEESMEKEVNKKNEEKKEHQWESNLLQEAKMDKKDKMEIESNKLENVVNVITPYGPADKVLSLSTTPSPMASPAALSSVPILGASETTEAKLQELVKSHKIGKEEEEKEEWRNPYGVTNKKKDKGHVTDAMFGQEMEVRRRSTRHQQERKINSYKRQKEEEEEEEKEKYLQSYFNGPNYYNRNYGTEMHQDRFQRNNIYNNKNNKESYYKVNDDEDEDEDEENVLNDCNDIFCMERVRVNVSELQWRCAEEQYLEEHGKSNELCLWYPATIVHVIDETSPLYRFMEMSRNGVSLDSDNESISDESEADDDVNESEEEEYYEEEEFLEKEQNEAQRKKKKSSGKSSKNKAHKSGQNKKHHLLPSESSRKVNHRHVHTRQDDSGSLLSRRFQIIAVFNATEMETGATIMATHSYITTDIIAHYKFSNKLVHMHPLGLDVELDYHYFNALLPISAQESSTSDSSDTSSLPPTHEEQQEHEHDDNDESEWKTQRVKRHEGDDTTITKTAASKIMKYIKV